MYRIARPRHRPPELVDRLLDPVPNSPALHVTKGQQRVGTVGRVKGSAAAVPGDRRMGRAVDVEVGEHRSFLQIGSGLAPLMTFVQSP